MPTKNGDKTDETQITRRGYLAVAGAGLAATGFTGTAAAQGSRISRRVVLPNGEDRFEDYNQNLFLHVIESTNVTLDIKEFDKCNFANWDPESTTAYRTHLIDSLEGDPNPVETNVFVNQTAAQVEDALEPGSLYIIDDEVDCPGRYVGLTVEWLSGNTPTGGAEGDGSPTTTSGFGPGFGTLSTLGAIGAGALARAWQQK